MQLSSLKEEVRDLLALEEADSSSVCDKSSRRRDDGGRIIDLTSDSEVFDIEKPPVKRVKESAGRNGWDLSEVSF